MMMAQSKNILITTTTFAEYDRKPLELLEQEGYAYMLNPYKRKLTSEEFMDLVGNAIGVIAGTEKIDSQALQKAKALKVISRCGVGIDNVDIKNAERLGIKVFNTPSGPTIAVAELVIGLMLDLLRNISVMNRQMHEGTWEKQMGRLLFGKTIGIVGFGQIGQAVGQKCQVLGAHVYYYDPFVKDKEGSMPLKLEELLKIADVVTVHVSFSEDSYNFFGKDQFSLMKKEAYFINCARGDVVDEKALYAALKEQNIAGAAIDVFDQEPYEGPLGELENVILTPHIGSYAKEARIQMEIEAVDNLLQSLRSVS